MVISRYTYILTNTDESNTILRNKLIVIHKSGSNILLSITRI